MGKKQMMILPCLGVLLIGAFTVGRNATSKSVRPNLPPQAAPSKQSPVVPDYVVYDFVFHKVVRLREKTRELQVQGRIEQKPYFPLQSEAGLNVGQTTALEAIAFACRQQVIQQDEKAKNVIIAFQSRFPEGTVPKGGAPPPPPELKISSCTGQSVQPTSCSSFSAGRVFPNLISSSKFTDTLRVGCPAASDECGFTVTPAKWVWCKPADYTSQRVTLAEIDIDVRKRTISVNGRDTKWDKGTEFFPQ